MALIHCMHGKYEKTTKLFLKCMVCSCLVTYCKTAYSSVPLYKLCTLAVNPQLFWVANTTAQTLEPVKPYETEHRMPLWRNINEAAPRHFVLFVFLLITHAELVHSLLLAEVIFTLVWLCQVFCWWDRLLYKASKP